MGHPREILAVPSVRFCVFIPYVRAPVCYSQYYRYSLRSHVDNWSQYINSCIIRLLPFQVDPHMWIDGPVLVSKDDFFYPKIFCKASQFKAHNNRHLAIVGIIGVLQV